eukprot:UN10337
MNVLQDASCLGIDFGKNGRSGECFFSTGQATVHESHSDFDAWKKTDTCENALTYTINEVYTGRQTCSNSKRIGQPCNNGT